jgi:hypothetical protein
MRKDFLGFRKALEKDQSVGFLPQYALKRAISHVAEGWRALFQTAGDLAVRCTRQGLRNLLGTLEFRQGIFVFVVFLQFHSSLEDFVILGFLAKDVFGNAGTDSDRIVRGPSRSVCGLGGRRCLRSCQSE